VTAALKSEGFGVVSTIDMQAKFKEKLGVDYPKYIILGACNPTFANKALQVEERIGVMLPCNIVLIEKDNDTIEIVAVNPKASMMAIQNPLLEPLAEEIAEKIRNVIKQLKDEI
ncbi:MAG: DUF302 domain-containing protein, partial [Bacteroidales bacterium]|nr:DUF302 domain-containing protein [Bacteroidales bacterium]